MQEPKTILPAEWFPQSGVQLTWPHENTEWAPILDEVIPCFVSIAKEIIKREKLVIVCENEMTVRQQLGEFDENKVIFCPMLTNDTWARDHGGISVIENDVPTIYDFAFNGWGLKYPANYDNMITQFMFAYDSVFSKEVEIANLRYLVLEGGSIESDGHGTLMTTEECLLSVNRNDFLSKEQIEAHLKQMFGLERVLWLSSGYLEGDDTDSHIDTLARFCSVDTIAYVQCRDEEDTHYEELQLMEEELKNFRQWNGHPYELIPLPMADKVEWEGERLPATYANFLIINGAVLVPFYNSPKDEIAKAALEYAFPDREVIGINCLPLIKQYGSLHCVTMQYPEGFIK